MPFSFFVFLCRRVFCPDISCLHHRLLASPDIPTRRRHTRRLLDMLKPYSSGSWLIYLGSASIVFLGFLLRLFPGPPCLGLPLLTPPALSSGLAGYTYTHSTQDAC
eukprot:GHVQ01018854.1.p1 GENE.GHVQ01018854.1~~GHVQ01018854.1.p1  ORF type:complete len:106 (-),score=2.88 GHVQ01018854.1:88-405(-)